jgi:hypothetical protein
MDINAPRCTRPTQGKTNATGLRRTMSVSDRLARRSYRAPCPLRLGLYRPALDATETATRGRRCGPASTERTIDHVCHLHQRLRGAQSIRPAAFNRRNSSACRRSKTRLRPGAEALVRRRARAAQLAQHKQDRPKRRAIGHPRPPRTRRLHTRNQRLNDLPQLITSHQPLATSRHPAPLIALRRPDTHPTNPTPAHLLGRPLASIRWRGGRVLSGRERRWRVPRC